MKSVSGIKEQESLRRRRERIIMAVAGFLVTLFCIIEYHLISKAGPLPVGSNILIFTVININILLILTLCFLVIRNIVKLIFEDRGHMLGARLRTKIVAAFIFLSLLPTMLLFFVSLYFLQTSLGYWFDSKVASALESAVILGQGYYDEQGNAIKKNAHDLAKIVSRKCVNNESDMNISCLESLFSDSEIFFSEKKELTKNSFNSLEILNKRGEVIWSITRLPMLQPPPPLDKEELKAVLGDRQDKIRGSAIENGELIRAVVAVRGVRGEVAALLVLGRFLPQNISVPLDEVRKGYEEYYQFLLFQDPIKTTLVVTLFLITMLIIFVAIWFGIRLARGITEPVQMLADATYRIAQGDLDFSLEAHGKDELSGLVRAFNTMTRDLKEARGMAEDASRDLRKSYREIEHSRAYMEILLQSITTGVISIDIKGNVTTMNRFAAGLLDRKSEDTIGLHYSVLLDQRQAGEFEAIRKELSESGKGVLQRHIIMERNGKKLSLLVNFAVLKDQDERPLGVIIVFDDLTEIEKVQRMAAWREVARRIAHEVKNPLTPIKLSAQRLNKKYREKFSGQEQAVFVRCTETIIGQAEELKRLVDEFSRFARTPAPRLQPVDLTEMVRSVISIYMDNSQGILFQFESPPACPRLNLDPDQIKRAIINIVDNAMSVMPNGGTITMKILNDAIHKKIRLAVTDTGPGIKESEKNRLFEPYFSGKAGGTGLGLAITNSIMADHEGKVYLEKDKGPGATFIMEFQVKED